LFAFTQGKLNFGEIAAIRESINADAKFCPNWENSTLKAIKSIEINRLNIDPSGRLRSHVAGSPSSLNRPQFRQASIGF
jgi:hypothetical protein